MPKSNETQLLQCDECGSVEFVEVEFHQYLKEWYSNMPDAHLRRITIDPIRIQVCLCGNPIWPGSLRAYASRMRESFRKSFEAALRHRDLIGRLTDVFASKQQYDSLAKRVAKLEQMLLGSPKKSK
jgi:hypothetical protein